MKRFTVCSLCLVVSLAIVLFAIERASAAPVGSPAGWLSKGQWDFGLEGGHLSRRAMETSGNANYEASITHGYHSRSYGLHKRLMVTGKLGGTYGHIYDETNSQIPVKTSLGGGLAMGIQLKGIIWEKSDSGVIWGVGTQFLYLRAHRKKSGKANTDWYEAQISTCLAKTFNKFKPYAGIKFSTVTLDHDDGKGNTVSYDEADSVGPFVGLDIYLGEDKDVAINLEGSLLLGSEFYGGIKYKF